MSASVWKKMRIKSISKVKDGSHGSYDRVDSGRLLLSCKNVFDNKLVIGKKERSISEDDYLEIVSNGFPQKNDILISCVGSIGRCCVFLQNEPIAFQRSVAFIRSEKMDPHFLMYRIQSEETQRQIKLAVNASAQGGIYIGSIEKLKITYPQDIAEQKRISTILSTCDTVIQNTQKTIEKYKAIKQGMMQDLFTRGLTKDGELRPSFKEAPELYKDSELGMIPKEWEVKELGECADINSSHLPIPNEFIYIDLESVIDGKLIIEKIMNKQNSPSRAQRVVSMNDILYQTVRPYQKNNLYFEFESKYKYVASTGYAQIKTDECSKYLFYFLHNDNFITEVLTRCTGTSYPAIVPKELEKVKVKMPLDIAEQTEIAKRLSSIDLTIQKEEAILSKYKNIKTGLMARLLTPPADAEIIDETEE